MPLNSNQVHTVRGANGELLHIDHTRAYGTEVWAGSAKDVAQAYLTTTGIQEYGLNNEMLSDLDGVIGDEPASEPMKLRYVATKRVKEITVVMFVQTVNKLPVWEAGMSVVVSPHMPGKLRVTSSQSTLHLPSPQLPTHFVLPSAAQMAHTPKSLSDNTLLSLLGFNAFNSIPKITSMRLLYYRYDPSNRLGWNPWAEDRDKQQTLEWNQPIVPLPTLPKSTVPTQPYMEMAHYVVTEVLFTMPVPTGEPVNWRAFVEVQHGDILYLRPFRASCLGKIFQLNLPPTAEDAENGEGDAGAVEGEVEMPAVETVAQAVALVFPTDPMTQTGTAPTTPADAALSDDSLAEDLRARVLLENLRDVPSSGIRRLRGDFIGLDDINSPALTPPSDKDIPYEFDYLPYAGPHSLSATEVDNQANYFTSVNAYYHCDSVFRMLQKLGFESHKASGGAISFPILDSTTFPIPVDPQGYGNYVEASCDGNEAGTGTMRLLFGRGKPDDDLGLAADVRVVLHEFCHVLLWGNVHSPNFGFAHSAGDSLAAILTDPCSQLKDEQRFETFPWVVYRNQADLKEKERRHGGRERDIKDGWAWGGTKDLDDTVANKEVPGYDREQILSCTLFRIYQALGGNSADPDIRCLAARHTMYLIVRAIGGLPYSEYTPTNTPDALATALMEADKAAGTNIAEGYPPYVDLQYGEIPGGTVHKLVRWGFRHQGLYQRSATGPAGGPVTSPGSTTPIDIYIDDGRKGEYGTDDFSCENTTEVWCRNTEGPGTPPEHEEPIINQLNYVYVNVRNCGYEVASGVIVRVYVTQNDDNLEWDPANWTPLTVHSTNSYEFEVSEPVEADEEGGQGELAGPFEWEPASLDKMCVLASVTREDDRSNIDAATNLPCAQNATPLWRLVPFDNNLACRAMQPKEPQGTP